jgi:hypothetical protein
MHYLKEVARVPGSHILPGVILLALSVAALFVWEVTRLTGGQTSGGRHRPIPRLIPRLMALTGFVLGAASFAFIAARFIWIA